MALIQHGLITRYLIFMLLWTFFYCHGRGNENTSETLVFFVQNTKYPGPADLDDKKEYINKVDNLYEVFRNYINSSLPLEERNDDNVCKKSRNETKDELLNSFKEFVLTNQANLVKPNSKLYIVLNGHGVQFETSKTYAFKTIGDDYVLLDDFAQILDDMLKDLPNVVFIVLTCRTQKKENERQRQYNLEVSQAHPKLQHVIIYACEEFSEVEVEKSVTLQCLIEALSGAADAENAFEKKRKDFHNGEVSLLEIWRYIEWRSKQESDAYKGECIPYCEGNNNVQTMWFSAVTKIRRAFLKPSTFNIEKAHSELIAIGDLENDMNEGSTPYPKNLPEKYRYKFRGTEFDKGAFQYCFFENVDFSNARFQSGSLRGTSFVNCILSEATIGTENVQWSSEKEGFKIER